MHSGKSAVLVLLSLLLFWPIAPPDARSQGTPVLAREVLGSAGTEASNPTYGLMGTLGQPLLAGRAASPATRCLDGFWAWWWVEAARVAVPMPQVFKNLLMQNYPNPFFGGTSIAYSVAQESPVEIMVFDVQGRKIRTLVRDRLPAGEYEVGWDGHSESGQRLASGVYFYRIAIGEYRAVKKLLMLK